MPTRGDLSGLSVLLIEDDFYTADDTTRALQDAGARVLGPYAAFEDAELVLAQTKPDCAVLDINLGYGPDFTSAQAMLSKGVPVMFVTGYDQQTIPSDLSHVRCLQKPTTARKIVQAVCQLCDGRAGSL